MKIRLGILGCGNMGSAIVSGLAKKSTVFAFYTYTPTFVRAEKLAKEVGGKAVKTISELKACDYFLIACKPQQFDLLAAELKKIVGKASKIISIMAGVSTAHLKTALGSEKVARAMPNTPCLVGEGTTAIYCVNMNEKEKETVKNIFEPIAQVHFVDSDDAIDIVTIGIASGSGYLFEIARILIEKLTAMGLPEKIASDMVKQMLKGSAALMQQSQSSPEELRNQVTSKGGTTEAALTIFGEKKLAEILGKALEAAYHRTKELGSK